VVLMANLSSGLLGNPLFMMGLGGLGASNPYQGWMNGLLANSQYGQQQQANEFNKLKLEQMRAQTSRQAAARKAMGTPGGTEMYGPPHRGQMEAQPTPGTGLFSSNPQEKQNALLQMAMASNDPVQAANMIQGINKGHDPIKLGAGDVLFDPITKKPIYSAPTKQNTPSNIQGYEYAKSQGYQGTYTQWLMDQKRAGSTRITNNLGDTLTPGQEAMDKAYAKNVVGFEAGGEYADTEKMMAQLDEVYQALGDPDKNLTGPIIGNTPNAILNIANPEAVDAKEAVEEVVQRNLKAILGAQFTEKEGERLISRAYNPALNEATNRRRVGRLIAQMKTAYAAKKSAADYLKNNGTLRGWGGKLPSYQDFYDALDSDQSAGAGAGGDDEFDKLWGAAK
jgi:hypothetical protein